MSERYFFPLMKNRHMSQPIMRGQFAMDQMRTNLLAEAANTIDMQLKGPVNITLTAVSADGEKIPERSFVIPAWLYANSDDGTFTIAMPTALPTEKTNPYHTTRYVSYVYVIDYTVRDEQGEGGANLWDDVERVREAVPPAATDYQTSINVYRISEETQSKCYMFRKASTTTPASANSFFPDFEQGAVQSTDREMDYIYIPPAAQRIGALVLKPYWTLDGVNVNPQPDGH